jgi:Arc/MetJ-type ribon-helix-helix transcriptional regulator
MKIDLTPGQEKIVKDQLESGHFRSVEQVIGGALQALRDKEQS